ncbi:MAG: diadenylate cyclase CdaA, partial [Planctomycetota bacterium]
MNFNQIAELISWPLQVTILAAAIYLFLRFLSTARGSGLMRGLVVAALFGLIGIAGLSELLELEEISKLVEDFTPSIAVILAILFQPELRRIISQLGEQNRLGQLIGQTRDEALPEVVQALSAMASRRTGALIAFERDLPLDEWTQNAVRLDSAVNRLALESIFHPGASLHDGAVVIRGDRVLAAACLFPLTENNQLSKSTGTRHRAALGLTEETDAVTVVVSEETGEIAIAKRGKMQRDIPIESLERTLREKLELSADEGTGAAAAARKGLRGAFAAAVDGLR